MKIYYEHWLFKLPFIRNYSGMAISANIVLIKGKKESVRKSLIDHEVLGHGLQYIAMDTVTVPTDIDAIVTFWLTYFISYLWNLAKYRNHYQAYKNIWLERMAREFE